MTKSNCFDCGGHGYRLYEPGGWWHGYSADVTREDLLRMYPTGSDEGRAKFVDELMAKLVKKPCHCAQEKAA